MVVPVDVDVLWSRAVRAESFGDGVLIFLDLCFFTREEGRVLRSLIVRVVNFFLSKGHEGSARKGPRISLSEGLFPARMKRLCRRSFVALYAMYIGSAEPWSNLVAFASSDDFVVVDRSVVNCRVREDMILQATSR